MNHLPPIALRDMIINAGLTAHTAAVPAIVEGYKNLKAKEDRTDDETRLFYECALCVMQNQIQGLGPEAFDVHAALIETHGMSYLRPAPEPEVEPEEALEEDEPTGEE